MSLPLLRLQNRHESARFVAEVTPPCFSLMTWSISNGKTHRLREVDNTRTVLAPFA